MVSPGILIILVNGFPYWFRVCIWVLKVLYNFSYRSHFIYRLFIYYNFYSYFESRLREYEDGNATITKYTRVPCVQLIFFPKTWKRAQWNLKCSAGVDVATFYEVPGNFLKSRSFLKWNLDFLKSRDGIHGNQNLDPLVAAELAVLRKAVFSCFLVFYFVSAKWFLVFNTLTFGQIGDAGVRFWIFASIFTK